MSLYLGTKKIAGMGARGADGTIIEVRELTVIVNHEGCALINSNANEIVLNAWLADGENGYIDTYFTQNVWFGKFKTYKEVIITGSHTIKIAVVRGDE